jgi:Na+/melibiose symporter-like transporter
MAISAFVLPTYFSNFL